jgi:hypothetical protein
MVRHWMTCLAMLAVAGCTKAYDETDTDDTDGVDTDVSQDTDGDGQCDAEVLRVLPLDGSLGVGVEEAISVSFTFAVAARDLDISLADDTGAVVNTSFALSNDGLVATVAHDPLAESTPYVLTVTSCAHPAVESMFETTAGPVDTTIEQHTYALDFNEVTWVEPAWASSLGSMLNLEYVLVQITDFDDALQELDAAGSIGFTSGQTGEIAQGACYDPVIYDNVDFSENPTFEIGPTDFSVAGQNFTVYGLTIQAAFGENGDSLVGIDMAGQIDNRQILTNTGLDACSIAELQGDACVACDVDGVMQCLDLWMTSDEAPYVPGLDVDESYVAADDPQCP